MQQKLKDAGYLSGNADGIYGPATESAVKKLQKANSLKEDGLYGYASDKALFSGGSGGGTTPVGNPTTNAKANNTKINVRNTPSTSGGVVAILNYPDALKVDLGTPFSADGYIWVPCISSKWTGTAYIAQTFLYIDDNITCSLGTITKNTTFFNRSYDNPYLRMGPDSSFPAKGTFVSGDVSTFTGGSGNQSRTFLLYGNNGQKLFVHQQSVKEASVQYMSTSIRKGKTNTSTNLRELPSNSATSYGNVGSGNWVLILDSSVADWYRVLTALGTGWMIRTSITLQ